MLLAHSGFSRPVRVPHFWLMGKGYDGRSGIRHSLPLQVWLIHGSEQVPHVFAFDAEFGDRPVSCRVSTDEGLGAFDLVAQ